MTTAYLTNKAYGYPLRGDKRRVAASRLMCIHITGNPNRPPATAMQERNYANRADSVGPSAHDYIDRDGSYVEAINPFFFAAWSNGDLDKPKLWVPGVREVVEFNAGFYYTNEAYYREVECCGNSSYPITEAQRETLAQLIAADSKTTGLPIERATVHMHSDLNTVNRPNCPVPAAQARAFVDSIIARAKQIAGPEEPVGPYEFKAERWTLDGAGKVTTLGAPKNADGTVNYDLRLALFSNPTTGPRLEEIERDRLTDPDDELTEEFYAALALYALPADIKHKIAVYVDGQRQFFAEV